MISDKTRKEILKAITPESLKAELLQYCNDILTGKIIACKKHKWACKRFLDDLEKSNNEDYSFYFDIDELYRFYMWCKMFKHRVGILAKRPIELVAIQLFICGNIFCWKYKGSGYRRFRKVYIQLARKNAKSQLLACIATYECFLSEEQAEVYITGWDRKGSNVVYREILFQIDTNTPKLFKGKYSTSYGKITHKKSGSFIEPLSKEAKNSDSANNPSLAIVDEYHQHITSEIYDSLLGGMVARTQPLIVIITTAGFDLSRPCCKEYQYVSKILDPDMNVDNDEYFVLICELDPEDDINDESVWIKANPIVASYENGINYLRQQLKTAIDAPEKMRTLLTKNFNRWVDMKENGYMNMTKWNANEEIFTLDKFRGMDCILGMDLSTKLDLTSIVFEFYLDGIYYTYQHSFLPEEEYNKRVRENKYNFALWKEQRYLTVIPGATIDYNYISDYIHEIEKAYGINILEICYDPAHAHQFVLDLEFEGYTTVEVRQGPFTLNEPTEDFRKQVYDNVMKHTNDGLYNWAMGNAVCANINRKQSYTMLDKAKSFEKIDPAAATINAHYRATKILAVGSTDIFYSPDI